MTLGLWIPDARGNDNLFSVTPANAGVYINRGPYNFWITASAGVTMARGNDNSPSVIPAYERGSIQMDSRVRGNDNRTQE